MIEHSYTDTNLINPVKKYAFVFVCHKGRLEVESLLMVASLKRFLRCDYELIAAIPTPESIFGEPSETTLNLLKKMGVRFEKVHNGFIEEVISKDPDIDLTDNKTLFLVNKAYALQIETSADKIIFIDSDMIFYKEFCEDISFSMPFISTIALLLSLIEITLTGMARHIVLVTPSG